MMDHFIYKTVCNVTGKYYLGMHSGSLGDTYLGSGIKLKNSIKKYGRLSHVRYIIQRCDTRDELSKLEEQLITHEIIADPLCMNLVPGGFGGFDKHSAKTKAKLREIAAFREPSHYVKGSAHGMFGKTHTPEVRERIRQAQSKPKGPFSDEHRKRLSEAAKARHARNRNL